MSNFKFNFEAHKKLSLQYATQLSFSLIWREILLQILPAAIIVLVLVLLKVLEPQPSIVFILLFVSIYVLFFLLTNQYIINSFTHIKNDNFSVVLVKDNNMLNKMNFYDCLCWRGSMLWRQIVVSVVIGIIAEVIGYFQLLSEVTLNNGTYGMSIGTEIASFCWVLITKKTGRLICIQPPKGSNVTQR